MSELGKRIKAIRAKRALSQEDLAELSKVNLRTIQRIENNETIPKGKTLRLIYDALDIEIIENDKMDLNKYFVWSSLLTVLIIISTFLTWVRFLDRYSIDNKKIYRIFNGWEGYTDFNDYNFNNWILSISSITIGLIVISHSLGLIKNKFKYVVLQLVILFLYLFGIISWSGIQSFEFRPGLFIILVTPILLIYSYRGKKLKTGANN